MFDPEFFPTPGLVAVKMLSPYFPRMKWRRDESTVGSVRDSLNTLRKQGLVTKSPVSFELAKKSPRAKKAKEQVEV